MPGWGGKWWLLARGAAPAGAPEASAGGGVGRWWGTGDVPTPRGGPLLAPG